jgi:serine/threonine protein phosphatase 1
MRRKYVIGDIHGRADLLKRLTDKIVADADAAGSFENVLIYLGDYVDRGPSSKEVLDILVSEPPSGFSAIYLMGNHEDMMLHVIMSGDSDVTNWVMNGGDKTFQSYGVDPMSGYSLECALPETHKYFLSSLDLYHEEDGFLFVHAGIRPGVALHEQTGLDLMWIRDEFLLSNEDFGKIVVHGHSIHPVAEIKFNRIGIDTGAWMSGVLTCLVLDGSERYFLSTQIKT